MLFQLVQPPIRSVRRHHRAQRPLINGTGILLVQAGRNERFHNEKATQIHAGRIPRQTDVKTSYIQRKTPTHPYILSVLKSQFWFKGGVQLFGWALSFRGLSASYTPLKPVIKWSRRFRGDSRVSIRRSQTALTETTKLILIDER